MKRKRSAMPSRHKIAEAWLKSPDSLDREVVGEFGSTARECDVCWRCGGTPGCAGIERAHIVPDCRGGSPEPLNLLLLCARCHKKQPDGMDRQTQLRWVCRGSSWSEMRADYEPVFLAAGMTLEEFAERHGTQSTDVLSEMFKKAMQVTAGPDNWKGNLSAILESSNAG
jgi:hypothetical protein